MGVVTGSNPIQPDLLQTVRQALGDRYDIHEEIGRGGMALVFRATGRHDGREVALKVLDPGLGIVVAHDRFRREIAILARLNHPAILPQLDSGESQGLLFFAMPLVKGETLRARLNREPQLPIEDALDITRTILSALAFAHGQNVIHRDIKPENILLEGGRAVVADFGIARAIVRSSGEKISTTGFAIGTPAYMSPEQVAGEARLDGRADLYSTGCVLYEMLSGGPPFTGPTPQAVQARHMYESPPSIRVVRPAVSPALQAVVEKSLAKVAGDRHRTAAKFAAALDRALDPTLPSSPGKKPWRRRAGWLTAAALTALVAAAVLLWKPAAKLDPEKYVVLPLRNRGHDLPGAVSATNATRLLWQSLNQWDGLHLVEEDLVEDLLRQHGDSALAFASGLALARNLGAGLMIWGEVVELGDNISVLAGVFPTREKEPGAIRREKVTLARSQASESGSVSRLMAKFAELGRQLIAPSIAGMTAPGEPTGTSSYPAFLATLSGDSALLSWNLPLARARYREAFTLDPNYAAPRLRFARASLWADAPESEWRPAAEAAVASTSGLAPFERLEAQGLVALGRADFPTACARFNEMIQRDSSRFAGWYGLGECLTRDRIVLPDPSSPSRWKYRGGYSSGLSAYERALTLVPLAHEAFGGAALSRLSYKFVAEPSIVRIGAALGDSTKRFAAYPELRNDTIAFVPYAIDEVVAGSSNVETKSQALALGRHTLLRITSAWLARYPASLPAISANAQALEANGQIAPAGPEELSALGLVQQLRAGKDSAGVDIQLAAWEVRLRLKVRQFGAARELAESALALPARTDEDGMTQAALAALTGQINRAADLSSRFNHWPFVTADGRFVETPASVAAIANRLLVYAAFGTPEDSIRSLAARLRREIEHSVDAPQREAALEATMLQPSLLAFPVLPPPVTRLLPTARIEQAVSRGALDEARREFAAQAAIRQFQLPWDVALDHAVLEARLLGHLGDSAAARARLDPYLDNPVGPGTDVLELVTQAAAVGRVMALWRELGNGSRAAASDTALKALWHHADGLLARQRRP